MDDCVYCKIIQGDIPAAKVYEDDTVLAFLDLHPLNPGHTLVVPKVHAENFMDADESSYLQVMKVARQLSIKINATVMPERMGMLIKGFDVPHLHVHLIPMKQDGDLVSGTHGAHLPPEAPLDEREALAALIRAA